jgi:hypothetical protein
MLIQRVNDKNNRGKDNSLSPKQQQNNKSSLSNSKIYPTDTNNMHTTQAKKEKIPFEVISHTSSQNDDEHRINRFDIQQSSNGALYIDDD